MVAQTEGLIQLILKGRKTDTHAESYKWFFLTTWLVERLLKGIQPVKAKDLLPVGHLHHGELTGVDLYFHRSLSGSVILLLSPGASNATGPGK